MLRTRVDKDAMLVFLEGEIDHCVSERLREEIEERIQKEEIKTLIFDFSGVTFMDSSGIGMLIGRYKTMAAREGKTRAKGLDGGVMRLFRMAGLHRIIEIIGEERKEEV